MSAAARPAGRRALLDKAAVVGGLTADRVPTSRPRVRARGPARARAPSGRHTRPGCRARPTMQTASADLPGPGPAHGARASPARRPRRRPGRRRAARCCAEAWAGSGGWGARCVPLPHAAGDRRSRRPARRPGRSPPVRHRRRRVPAYRRSSRPTISLRGASGRLRTEGSTTQALATRSPAATSPATRVPGLPKYWPRRPGRPVQQRGGGGGPLTGAARHRSSAIAPRPSKTWADMDAAARAQAAGTGACG